MLFTYSSAYIWSKILSSLEQQLTAQLVSSLLDDADIVEVSDSQLVLSSPTEYRRKMILSRLSPYIVSSMKDLFNRDVTVSVISSEEAEEFHSARKPDDSFIFNPQFTFDRFVVGESNRFAHAAAFAVAENPAAAYNPLFIYGQSGLGKTHLLYAIAGEIHRLHPDYNIVYIKGDQFTNELISAIQEGKNFEFRDKYRNADLFLMDDIQFIAGKERTQEEFFHTFNSLYEAKKQIVLTSDRSPHDVQKLDDRLRTRFEWGLTADIQPPDYETRVAILKNKAYSLGRDFPEDVSSYIAENISSNVRQLEGAVKNIIAVSDLTGEPISMQLVARALKSLIKERAEPTAANIIAEVCSFYSIDESILRSSKQDKITTEARQIAMYLIRTMTQMSFPDIGREFGKDHTTVIYAYNKILKNLKDNSTGLSDNIRSLLSEINSKL